MPKFLLFSYLFLFSIPLWAQAPEFKLNRTFGTPVITPMDIALDKGNFMYVLERRAINKFDLAGNFIESINLFAEDLDLNAIDLDLDKDGNFYLLLARNLNPQVMKFSPEGKLLLQFGTSSPDGGPDQFWWAASLTVDAQGNILIADSDNGRIQKFNARGEFVVGFKVPKATNSVWENPYDLKVGKSGTIYYVSGSPDLYKISPDGQKIEKTAFSLPLVYGGRVYLALDEEENVYFSYTEKIYKVSGSGQLLQTFDVVMPGAGGWPVSFAIAVSRDGDLYAVNKNSSPMIQVFAASGSLKKITRYQESHFAVTQDDLGGFFVLTYDRFHATQKYSIKRFNALGMQTGRFGDAGQEAEKLVNPLAIAADQSGNVYCLDVPAAGKAQIKKFDNEGKYVASFEDFGDLEDPAQTSFKGLALDNQGNIYIADAGGACIRKISAAGKFIGRIGTRGAGSEWGKINALNGLTVDAKGNIYIADEGGRRIQKFSPDGQVVPGYGDYTTFTPAGPGALPFSLAVDAAGYLYVNHENGRSINVFDPTGKRLQPEWSLLGKSGLALGQISLNREGTKMLIAGGPAVWEYLSSEAARESLITGKIFQDANFNCLADPNEKPLAGIVVKAEPGPYYGVSDEAGNYMIPVDTGSYTVQPILPRDPVAGRTITPSCPTNFPPVKVQSHHSYRQGPDLGHEVRTAPVLKVEVASNRRRRCFRNITTVSYANTGFASAPNAKVTVQLPEFVSFISASMPHTKDAKGNYIFAVGTLQPSQRGTITLIDSVSCADPNIRGLTVCTKAWITPVNTYPTPASWNKADISVTGKTLDGNQARFVIRNNGPGDMTDSLLFRIYQDAALLLSSRYKLAAQDSLVLRFAPTGRALRLEADQPEGHPLKASAGVNVEVKPRLASLPAIPMMAFPPDDPEPEIAQDCLPIIDSFDPNDKQVLPAGLTAEHYTPTNSPLRYTIRFQNTGTDVAYRVVVVDTLSADLDLATLQVGAASHGYKLAVTGKTRPVLTFTFNNIMLPDSASDQAGSNGFIQFSIKPKKGLPEKAGIENFADIFFDFNEPVRTNTTLNRIYDMPLEVKAEQQLLARDIITSPALYRFSPLQSRAGQVVRLKGRNFAVPAAGNQVTFNGVAATVLSASDSVLTVLVPANAFSGKIQVLTPDGGAKSSSDYVIFQPPTLTAVSATEGLPGTVVTLTGTHFSPVAAQDTVTFNGVVAKVLQATETSLQVEVPAGASLGKILVRTLGGQVESAQAFMVWYPPVITDFSPRKGKAGTALVLNGSNFAGAAARNQVQFGTAPAQVLAAAAGRLLVKVPAAAPSGQIRVQTPGGTALTPLDFTFIPAPEITAFTPARGNAGATITLTGRFFNADGQADAVYFNGLPAKVIKATETLLKVQAPKGVASGTITVAGAGGKAEAAGFEVPDLKPEQAIDIYPNPTKAAITINWFKADFTLERLLIYNAIGKLVADLGPGTASQDELEIPLARFGAGIYTVSFQTSQGPVIKRVVVL